MPSSLELARVEDERPEFDFPTKIILGLIFSILYILLAAVLGIKSHVLLNTPSGVFKACGYETVYTYFSGSSIAMVGSFTVGLMAATVLAGRTADFWRRFDVLFAGILLFTMIGFYYFFGLVLIILAWSEASEVEKLLPFYSEFYAGFSSKCANGENLYNLELGVATFKVESFILLLGFILECFCMTLYCFDSEPEEK